MTHPESIEVLTEELVFLFQELSITAGLLLQALRPSIQGLLGGRSPQGLKLEDHLEIPTEYLNSMKGIQKEIQKDLKNFPIPEFRDKTEQEYDFWTQYLETAEGLLKKLSLLALESKITSLGKMPIEDAWRDLERMAQG